MKKKKKKCRIRKESVYIIGLTFDVDTGMVFDNVVAVFGHFIPIDNVPEVAYIFGSTILVLKTRDEFKKTIGSTIVCHCIV